MRRHLEGIDLATTPALLRRATPGKYLVRLSAWCYNSRSPAENDGMCYTLMTRDNTRYNSRSLLRRATPLAVEPLDDALAPTHALLRGAPIHHSFSSVSFVSYNSRSPAESDPTLEFIRFAVCVAPTHALLRRATVLFSSAAGVPTRYNSRSPAESDFAFRHLLPAL